MKTRLHLSILVALTVKCSCLNAAVLDIAETWPDHSVQGWECFDHAGLVPSKPSFSVINGKLTLAPRIFKNLEDDPKWSFTAQPASSSGIFSGDYADAGALTISFDIESSVPATLSVELACESAFLIYGASMVVASGTTHIEIPLDDSHFYPDTLSVSNQFSTVLHSVEKVFITLEWDKTSLNPIFSIDNVKLVGSEDLYGGWIEKFGLDSALTGYNVDADGDGLLNLYEYVIDSLPNVSNGPFAISMETNAVIWAGSSNCTYTVLRSTNLVEGLFEPAGILPGISDKMYYLNAGSSNAFYIIEVERH